MTVECLKLRVEVLLTVLAIGEGVEADLVLIVRIEVPERHRVPSNVDLRLFKRDLLLVVGILGDLLLFIDAQL